MTRQQPNHPYIPKYLSMAAFADTAAFVTKISTYSDALSSRRATGSSIFPSLAMCPKSLHGINNLMVLYKIEGLWTQSSFHFQVRSVATIIQIYRSGTTPMDRRDPV